MKLGIDLKHTYIKKQWKTYGCCIGAGIVVPNISEPTNVCNATDESSEHDNDQDENELVRDDATIHRL